MKKFLHIPSCLLALSLNLTAFAAPPSIAELEQLTQSNEKLIWSKWVQSQDEYKQLRSNLEKLYHQSGLTGVQYRALEELGFLSADEQGKIHEDVHQLFSEVGALPTQSRFDFAMRLALLRALRNSNTPESLEMLAELVNNNDYELADFALRMIEEIVAPRPDSAPAPGPFEPSLGIPLDARGGREREWIHAAEKAKQAVEQLRKNISNEKVAGNAEHSAQVLEAAITTAQNSMASQGSGPASKDGQNKERGAGQIKGVPGAALQPRNYSEYVPANLNKNLLRTALLLGAAVALIVLYLTNRSKS